MDALKQKERKGNLIIKTWERCMSIGRSRKQDSVPALTVKSKSWPCIPGQSCYLRSSKSFLHLEEELVEEEERGSRKRRVAPEGCFSVYVGPEKQRFVIKTEYVNHPLFKLLLEEAESEYGFHSEGPLVLPCKVDVFYRVLLAMDNIHQGCGFAKGYRLSPSRMVAINQF